MFSMITKKHLTDCTLNPFKPNEISLSYQLDQSISVLRVVGWCFSILFKFKKIILQANRGDPDQMLHYAMSDLGVHCLLCPIIRTLGLHEYGLKSTYTYVLVQKYENLYHNLSYLLAFCMITSRQQLRSCWEGQ